MSRRWGRRVPVAPAAPARDPGAPGDTSRPRRAPLGGFQPDYRYVIQDLRRIGLLAGGILAFLVILSLFLD
ncbi:MAG: hypothetical protein ACRDHY_05560 [Anaerolineales bacterium]